MPDDREKIETRRMTYFTEGSSKRSNRNQRGLVEMTCFRSHIQKWQDLEELITEDGEETEIINDRR